MRCELLGTADQALRVSGANVHQHVGVLTSDADRTNLSMFICEFGNDRFGDNHPTVGGYHDRIRAVLQRESKEADVLIRRRWTAIVARRMNSMLVITKPSRVAGEP